jgi:hypothetical protein
MSRDFTLVFYTILEDFDDPEQPNAFGVNKAVGEITLKDIKQAFPLEGTYHFRFKYLHNKIPVWMDLNNEDAHLPLFAGKVIAKVTRISWESNSFVRPAAPQKTPVVSQPTAVKEPAQQPTAVKREMDIFAASEAPRAKELSTTDYDLLFSH